MPLSTSAIEILLYAEAMTGGGHGLVFPAKRSKGIISRDQFSNHMNKLGIAAKPHGFRSSFRNWAGGSGVPEPVAERVLAHKAKDQTVEAYLHDPFIQERTPVMQLWADYIAETMGAVISPEDQDQDAADITGTATP